MSWLSKYSKMDCFKLAEHQKLFWLKFVNRNFSAPLVFIIIACGFAAGAGVYDLKP